MRTTLVKHAENAIAFRLDTENKQSITYSGDTDFCESIINLANQTDILLIECSFPKNKKVPGHLTAEEVGIIASESLSKKVILTHLYPVFEKNASVQEVKEQYNGEVIEGKDLLFFQIM